MIFSKVFKCKKSALKYEYLLKKNYKLRKQIKMQYLNKFEAD